MRARPCAGNGARAGRRGPQGPGGVAGATGAAGLSATKLWAQIAADGSVNASSSGVTARAGVSPGTYAVNFGLDITRCAAMATQGAIPAYAASGSTAGGLAGAPLLRVYSAGTDLAPGYPSISTVLVTTTTKPPWARPPRRRSTSRSSADAGMHLELCGDGHPRSGARSSLRGTTMRKPSAALLVASAALVMATIGTSVAASGYTITSSRQIKPGSISLASLSKGARKALHGARGPAGPQGDDGLDGADGEDGADGRTARTR